MVGQQVHKYTAPTRKALFHACMHAPHFFGVRQKQTKMPTLSGRGKCADMLSSSLCAS